MATNKATFTCFVNDLQDSYKMGQHKTVVDILDKLREESEKGNEIVINDKFTNGQTRQQEQRTLHRFPDKEKLEEWIKNTFPNL